MLLGDITVSSDQNSQLTAGTQASKERSAGERLKLAYLHILSFECFFLNLSFILFVEFILSNGLHFAVIVLRSIVCYRKKACRNLEITLHYLAGTEV